MNHTVANPGIMFHLQERVPNKPSDHMWGFLAPSTHSLLWSSWLWAMVCVLISTMY